MNSLVGRRWRSRGSPATLGLQRGEPYNHSLHSQTTKGRHMNKIVTTPRGDERIEIPNPVEEKIIVLNPVGYPPKVTKKTAAPRPESLDGKTIYLVDCRFDDSIELLKQVQAWFGEHMAGVTTRIISLSSINQHDDPKTWEEIK